MKHDLIYRHLPVFVTAFSVDMSLSIAKDYPEIPFSSFPRNTLSLTTNMPHLWLRAETKPMEHRAALTPKIAKVLLDAGTCWIGFLRVFFFFLKKKTFCVLYTCTCKDYSDLATFNYRDRRFSNHRRAFARPYFR